MTQTSRISLSVKGSQTGTNDFAAPAAPLDYKATLDLADGTGLNQASVMFSDQRTLAASASEELDLSGSLADVLGVSLVLTKIKALVIKAAPGNTNDVVVGGAASNGCATMFGDPTDKINVKPGGMLVLTAPTVAGYAVTAGTGDLLKVANSGGTTGVTYDIIILGA